MSIRSSYPSIAPSLSLDFAKSRRLDPRISFTRAQTGNIATYIGSDGLVKYAGPDEPRFDHKPTFRTNLLPNSEALEGYWNENQGMSLDATSSVINPFGNAFSYLITEDTNVSVHSVYRSLVVNSGQTITSSIFIKAFNRTEGFLYVDAPGGNNIGFVKFNLLTGITTTSTGSGTGVLTGSGITPYGNGWYRVWITGSISGQNAYFFHVNSGESLTAFQGNGLGAFYIFGPQMEAANAPTDYIATGPSAVTRTRTESLGLLVEESRTNLSLNSQDFTDNSSNTAWAIGTGKSRATLISNTGNLDPSGGTTASRWASGTTNNTELIYHLLPTVLTIGATYTASCWIRRVSGTGEVGFIIGDNAGGFVTSQLDSVPYGTWVRCSFSKMITGENGSPSRAYIVVYPDGFTSGNPTTIDIWGYQMEQGGFPTSYIPTTNTTVTRTADNVSMVGENFSSWYNQSEGAILCCINPVGVNPAGASPYWELGNGQNTDLMWGGRAGPTSLMFRFNSRVSAVVDADIQVGNMPFNTLSKTISAYKENNYAASVNGLNIIEDTSVSVPQNISRLLIGGFVFGANASNCIAQLTYYPRRLTDAQLINLTK